MSHMSPPDRALPRVLCASGTFEQLFTYVVFGLWIFFGLIIILLGIPAYVYWKRKAVKPRPREAPSTPAAGA